MATVKRRGTGWQATYRGPDHRERTKTFALKIDAERWLDLNGADIARGQWVDPRLGKVLFGDWAEQWTATTVANRVSTRARDASYLRTHILPVFGDRSLGSISHLEVRGWVAELSSRKAPATCQKAFQILGKIMSAGVDAGIIPTNPCDRVPLPRVEREEMRFLNPEEVARLAAAITPRYRALVLLGAYGGLRIGELAGLRRGRIDVLRSRVDIAEICVEVSGHLTYGQPKTRAGRRSISLPRSVAAALNEHLSDYTETVRDAFVFTAPEGGALRVPAWRRRHWAPAVEAAGLDPLRPHDLRHTAVALWIASGANPLEVSRRAGHTSTSFTQDRYGHLYPEADSSLAARLDALVAQATERNSELWPGQASGV
jgi:integrase